MAKLREGETFLVSVNIESREYNGRWYTDIRAWRVQPKQQQPPVPMTDAPLPSDIPAEGGSFGGGKPPPRWTTCRSEREGVFITDGGRSSSNSARRPFRVRQFVRRAWYEGSGYFSVVLPSIPNVETITIFSSMLFGFETVMPYFADWRFVEREVVGAFAVFTGREGQIIHVVACTWKVPAAAMMAVRRFLAGFMRKIRTIDIGSAALSLTRTTSAIGRALSKRTLARAPSMSIFVLALFTANPATRTLPPVRVWTVCFPTVWRSRRDKLPLLHLRIRVRGSVPLHSPAATTATTVSRNRNFLSICLSIEFYVDAKIAFSFGFSNRSFELFNMCVSLGGQRDASVRFGRKRRMT